MCSSVENKKHRNKYISITVTLHKSIAYIYEGLEGGEVRTQTEREGVIGVTEAETGLPGPVQKENNNNNNKPVLRYTGLRHRRKIQALKKPP